MVEFVLLELEQFQHGDENGGQAVTLLLPIINGAVDGYVT